ncbi:hypothetical protein LIER_31123 [Lithospermum erythrorhizon]|uniref:Uncharacterized protein n=1 Tax=Lithospermum erythrorhizon TaxID=34254 RepID=A0AAV3RTK7_LITER
MFGSNVFTRRSCPDSTTASPRTPLMNNNATSPGTAEIDTSAPFQSVRAAIGLFGELSPKIGDDNSHKRSKSTFDERVLEKETQHHMAIRELESLREQLRSIEISKAQALKDLDKAKYTLDKLTNKLDAICESKQAAIAATEDAKNRLEELEEDQTSNKGVTHVDDVRNQYKECAAEIDSVKQYITALKQDFDAALEAKLAAFQEADEAQHVTEENQQKAAQISEELSNLQRELNEVKLITQRAQDEHDKLMAEKQARIQSCKASKEEIENKLRALKEESGLNGYENSKEKLEATNEAVTLLTERLNTVRASDMEDLNNITSELEHAKKDVQQLVSEQNSLSSLVNSLKQKKEINATLISQAEELKKQAELYKQEAQEARIATEEIEKKLQIALTEAKEAKAALNLESVIKLTVEEFDELKKKAESSKTNANLEVTTANAENEKTVLQKVEESQKENEALKIAIEDAKKQAETADAARAMVEGELRKWQGAP